MRNIAITLFLVTLFTLAAIGIGGMVGFFLICYPSASCMVLNLAGLCQ
jgi:hypothetical protein